MVNLEEVNSFVSAVNTSDKFIFFEFADDNTGVQVPAESTAELIMDGIIIKGINVSVPAGNSLSVSALDSTIPQEAFSNVPQFGQAFLGPSTVELLFNTALTEPRGPDINIEFDARDLSGNN